MADFENRVLLHLDMIKELNREDWITFSRPLNSFYKIVRGSISEVLSETGLKAQVLSVTANCLSRLFANPTSKEPLTDSLRSLLHSLS